MNNFSRRTFLGLGGAAAAVTTSQLITSCSTPPESEEESISLYSSRHYNTDDELYETFTRETGIKVNLVEGKADELLERIKSEGANSKADVFMTVDVARLWRATQEGIFTPISSSVLTDRIPAYLRDPDNNWFGFTKRARVIIYSKERVKPTELSTYEAMADPKWKGKVLVRSSSNTYNQSLVASMIVTKGEAETEAWCKGLVGNFAREPEGNDTAQITAVAAGVGDLAIANTYYVARLGHSEEAGKKAIFDKVGVFFPNQGGRGAHVNISGAGVVKTAPNQAGAIKFLEFLSTSMAQAFFAQGNYEYPVVEGLAIDPILASFGTFKSDETNLAEFGPQLASAVKVMNQAGWK